MLIRVKCISYWIGNMLKVVHASCSKRCDLLPFGSGLAELVDGVNKGALSV